MRQPLMLILWFIAAAVASSAQTFNTLANFDNTNGRDPWMAPTLGADGNLYGATTEGGANGGGTIYKLTPHGTLSVMYNFNRCYPTSCADGSTPVVLIHASDGGLYGTTSQGGANGRGEIFKMTTAGNLTVLYSFCSQANCADGTNPDGLIQASNGNFYGTTMGNGGTDWGTFFELTPQGKLTTLYSFCPQSPCTGGYNLDRLAILVEDSAGNFYGTNGDGGNTTGLCGVNGCGTIFKITARGEYTTLYTFCAKVDCSDGSVPNSLVLAADGNFYGTTIGGGSHRRPFGAGTFFKLTATGDLTTLYSFCGESGCSDGFGPGTLTQGADGNFYGGTIYGGTSSVCKGKGCGTLFEITPEGVLTTLHNFDFQDGILPAIGLMQGANQTFYGATSLGGAKGDNGTVFSLTLGSDSAAISVGH